MKFSIRNLKIRHQILLITVPPLFVLLSAIALAYYAYWVSAHTDRLARKAQESLVRTEALWRHLTEMNMGVRTYVLTRQQSLLVPYDVAAVEVPQDLAALRELQSDNPTQLAKVEAIEFEVNRWESEWVTPIINKLRRGEGLEMPSVAGEGEARMASLRRQILKLLQEEQAEYFAQRHEVERGTRRMLAVALGLGLLVASVSLYLNQKVTRQIAQPVRQLIEASERVSHGDFQPSLPPPARSEFGMLSESFSRMMTALRNEREELAALNKFSEAVTQCTSEREVYDHILHSLKERFQPRQVMIFKLNAADNFLEAVATLAPLPAGLGDWPVIEEPHNCKAVRMGRAFMVNDVTVEPLCSAKFAPPTQGSYYCGPLIAGGIIIGAVRLEGVANLWTPERVSLLESYLSGAATALSNLRLLQTMKQQASVDELTGLYNRRFLEDYARKLIAMASRKSQPLSLVMMDLDLFKTFNDEYGHEVGDRILRQFAKTITQAMRETNLAARFGGEEFVVLLPDTGPQACLLVAERIRQTVARMVVPSGTDKPLPQVTVSLGIAVYPEHGRTLEELLQASDKALYESKHSGRNRSTLYVAELESAS